MGNEALVSEHPEDIERHIEATRASLDEKVHRLETAVQSRFHEAKESVPDLASVCSW